MLKNFASLLVSARTAWDEKSLERLVGKIIDEKNKLEDGKSRLASDEILLKLSADLVGKITQLSFERASQLRLSHPKMNNSSNENQRPFLLWLIDESKYLIHEEDSWNYKLFKGLLDAGLNPNCEDGYHRTPLIGAAEGHTDSATKTSIMSLLINHGANINAQDHHGWSALHYSVHRDKPGEVLYLCEQGIDKELKTSAGSATAFLYAANSDRDECIQILLQQGANRHAYGDDGLTGMHQAAKQGKVEVIKALYAAGLDTNGITPNNLIPPLHWAVLTGQVEVLECLINCGADPFAKDSEGFTPRDYAKKYLGPNAKRVSEALEALWCAYDERNMLKDLLKDSVLKRPAESSNANAEGVTKRKMVL